MEVLVYIGLFIILLIVLLGPFKARVIEHNLEVFLFLCGVIALSLSNFVTIEGEVTGWSYAIVGEALSTPLLITQVYGIPLGIVQIVLLVGLIIHYWHAPIANGIGKLAAQFPPPIIIFVLIVVLGLVSSVISAIIAAIILVEVICALPLARKSQVRLTVISCFSIGIGAALTPLGEPLSTIAIFKLSGPPYYASFNFLIQMLGIYIIPGIVAFGLFGAMFMHQIGNEQDLEKCVIPQESLREVVIRAAKIYLFIMALVFLGEGFKPIILTYVIHIPPVALYWVNTVSAVLDNATLTATIISPALTELQIRSTLIAILVAGGMLIPGNIPNIIAAGKLRITSREWAKDGIPIGFIAMIIYFAFLFVPACAGM